LKFVRQAVRKHVRDFFCPMCHTFSVARETYEQRQSSRPCAILWNQRYVCQRCSRRPDLEAFTRANLAALYLNRAQVARAVKQGDVKTEIPFNHRGHDTFLYKASEIRALAAKLYGGIEKYRALRDRVETLDLSLPTKTIAECKEIRKRRRTELQQARSAAAATNAKTKNPRKRRRLDSKENKDNKENKDDAGENQAHSLDSNSNAHANQVQTESALVDVTHHSVALLSRTDAK